MTPEAQAIALVKSNMSKHTQEGLGVRGKLYRSAVKEAQIEAIEKLEGVDKHDFNSKFHWEGVVKILNKLQS